MSLECQGAKVPVSLIRLLNDKTILVGAIDVANQAIETPEAVAGILGEALKHADAERIQACTNCGMAPLPRGVADGQAQCAGGRGGADALADDVRRRRVAEVIP